MLNQKYRFHSRGGVKYTYQNGKTIRGAKISLVHAVNSHKAQRFAVVVSKKVLKSAVGRNRIRRRVYEAIRLNLNQIPGKKDYLFVIYSKDVKDMPFDDLQSLILSLVKESMI